MFCGKSPLDIQNLMQGHVKYQAGEAQPGIKITRKNINNLRYTDAVSSSSEEELKNLLMKVKEESEKVA